MSLYNSPSPKNSIFSAEGWKIEYFYKDGIQLLSCQGPAREFIRVYRSIINREEPTNAFSLIPEFLY